MAAPGGVPERPKGTGCKPVGSAYGGSNPPAPTKGEDSKRSTAVTEDLCGKRGSAHLTDPPSRFSRNSLSEPRPRFPRNKLHDRD
jgi:hypothetical protein